MLPEIDAAFLADKRINHTVQNDAGMVCVLMPSWQVPPGYHQQETDLLLRLAPGYPDVPPDMWWCDPGLVLVNGSAPQATEVTEQYFGRSWQRWSRHFTEPGQWRSGIDGLASYLTRLKAEVARSAGITT